MSGLGIVHRYAVDEKCVLLKRGAPYIDVGLNAFSAAAPDIYAAEIADDILQSVIGRTLHIFSIERGYGSACIGMILNAGGRYEDLFKLVALFREGAAAKHRKCQYRE